MLIISESLKNKYSGGLIGTILFKNASNSELNQSLEKKKEELESNLRNQYGNLNRLDLGSTEPIKTYVSSTYENVPKKLKH